MYRLMPFNRRTAVVVAALSSLAVMPRIAAAQGACGVGEATIHAGDARLASLTPNPVDSMGMEMEQNGARRPFGTFSQHVEHATVDGQSALLFVQRGSTPRGATLDSIWVDARTWAPLRHVATGPGNTFAVTFRGGRATGRRMQGDTMRAVSDAVPDGTLNFAVANTAIHAIPFCDGVVIRMAGYDPSTGQMRDAVFHVLEAASLEIGGEVRDVWVAELTTGGRTGRLYVDRATGRELEFAIIGPGGATLRGTSAIFDAR
jgi:hypothetical protein